VLWNTIGTAYGAGDGSTTFNVPDLRGRVPVGVGSHTDVSALGKNEGGTGNSSTVPLTDRRPKHKHTKNGGASLTGNVAFSDPGHGHAIDTHTVFGDPQPALQGGSNNNNQGYTATDPSNPVNSNTTGITVNNGTLSVNDSITIGPQTNVPIDSEAYVTFNYIIKF
jgi:microcystin-dependent protein